jgi:hypothetical protein
MPIVAVGAYVAGFASGWIARSAVSSSREVVVQAIVLVHRAKDGVRRVVAEQREWLEDLLAEGRARYEHGQTEPIADARARPRVVANDGGSARAA